ncbi:glutathione S-transferase [Obba rivulosa]|uniref:Glutathione S-transferase n=1 Tax=Obba rivulosa TaxID=1052685 RepID=A0A8E2DLM9_9APHY|nr:glutathione S-transferase [Obba rivulosa]
MRSKRGVRCSSSRPLEAETSGMPEQITLYAAYISPFAQAVDLALLQAQAKYTRYEIDLKNKPDWYLAQVNPVGKVPTIAYGGPIVLPEQPSPESVKLRESRVILEFIADLFPEAHLLPKDPILRAKARFFLDFVHTKFIPPWVGHFRLGHPAEPFFAALEELQALLPSSGFAVGEWSIADAAAAPVLARMEVFLELNHPLSGWSGDEARRVLDTLKTSRFARINQYLNDLMEQPSFKATFDKTKVMVGLKPWFDHLYLRGQK